MEESDDTLLDNMESLFEEVDNLSKTFEESQRQEQIENESKKSKIGEEIGRDVEMSNEDVNNEKDANKDEHVVDPLVMNLEADKGVNIKESDKEVKNEEIDKQVNKNQDDCGKKIGCIDNVKDTNLETDEVVNSTGSHRQKCTFTPTNSVMENVEKSCPDMKTTDEGVENGGDNDEVQNHKERNVENDRICVSSGYEPDEIDGDITGSDEDSLTHTKLWKQQFIDTISTKAPIHVNCGQTVNEEPVSDNNSADGETTHEIVNEASAHDNGDITVIEIDKAKMTDPKGKNNLKDKTDDKCKLGDKTIFKLSAETEGREFTVIEAHNSNKDDHISKPYDKTEDEETKIGIDSPNKTDPNNKDKSDDKIVPEREDETISNVFLKKRKRNISTYDLEQTPKQRKVFFYPQYSGNSKIISPIKCSEGDHQSRVINIAESPSKKFDVYNEEYINACSTPIVPTEKDKLKAKSLLKFPNDTHDLSSMYKSYMEDVDDLIRNITAICDEGLNRKRDSPCAHDEINEGNQISKIDIKDLIEEIDEELGDTLVGEMGEDDVIGTYALKDALKDLRESNVFIKENKTLENEYTYNGEKKENETEGKDIGADNTNDKLSASAFELNTSNECERTGRFKDVTAVYSMAEVLDDEEEVDEGENEDLLGLDDLDDGDGFIDAKALVHLSKSGVVPEIKDKELEANKTLKTEGDKPNNEENVCEMEIDIRLVEKSNKTITDSKRSPKQKLNGIKPEKDNKQKTSDHSDQYNLQIMADYDKSSCRLIDDSDEMYAARLRWGSSGAPNPEVNLTVATTMHRECMASGRLSPVALLEGEKLCCLNLYESEFDGYAECNEVANVLSKLHTQSEVLEKMHYDSMYILRMEMGTELQELEDRHTREITYLRYRQKCEHAHLIERNDMNTYDKEQAIMRLPTEHRAQRAHLKDLHDAAYKDLCRSWNARLLEDVEHYKRRREWLDEQIIQFEESDNACHSENGPSVVVNLRKAASKDTDYRHTHVSMVLSARVAQAIVLEDDIYDHFYKHAKFSKKSGGKKLAM